VAIIYFGISSLNNVKRNIDRWAGITGKPDIFAEKEENLEKYQEKLLGKYEVVSIDEALKRYPGADVYVTYKKAGNSAKHLLSKLPLERVHFLEADLEYRKGCDYLGHFINYRKESFSPCPIFGEAPVARAYGTIGERLKQWQDYTEKLIGDIRDEKTNDCQNCPMLSYSFWPKTVKLDEFFMESLQYGDACNFNCSYCFCESSFKSHKNGGAGFTTYDVLHGLSKIPEYDTEDFLVRLSNGEICANPFCDEIIDVLTGTQWRIELESNFSVFNEKLARLMEEGRIAKAITSLDAGTKKTFKRIKQVDAYGSVLANLKKYPLDKTKFYLKYIFLEDVNDNEKDLDGFYEVAKELGAIVSLSSNLNALYTERMRELCYGMVKKAEIDGVKVVISSAYLNSADREAFYKLKA